MRIAFLRHVARATPRTRLLHLDLGDQGFSFRAGQAVVAGLADRATRAAYSIASPPAAAARGLLELLVPSEGAFGESGLDPAELIGQAVAIEGPFGTFGVPADAEHAPLLLVAGGTGIAPLRSVALDRAGRGRPSDVTLVYSARTADEFAFDDELRTLASKGRVTLHQTVTRDERVAWPGRAGRVDESLLRSAWHGPDVWCLVCGPTAFVQTVTETLMRLGVAEARIATER